MFVPPIKAPQAKTASQTTPTCAYKPPQRTPLWPGASLSNQAVLRSLRFAAQQAERLAESTSANHQMREADPERIASRQGVQGASWDFSKVPVFAPDLPSRSEPPPPLLQLKVAIGPVNDPLEHEADRVADQVMRMPEPQLQRACACGGGCPECQMEQPRQEHEPLQSKRIGTGDLGQRAVPTIVHEALRSPGQSLDPATRGFMESRFRHDFSLVRVHNNAKGAESSRALCARAYTTGRDIVFGAGQYAPETQTGRRLIAHELAHVVQQNTPLSMAAVVQRQSSLNMDPVELSRFNSIYNQATGAYSFLTQQQTLAIDSIYTEAKKPRNPSLVEELLIALATAGISGAISIVGQKLTALIPKVFNVAEAGTTSNELIERHVAQARARVEIITRGSFDAFKDGAKSLAVPRIRELIQAGKLPIDAFFEGEKKLVVEAGRKAFDEVEQGRTDVLSLAVIHPLLPKFAARALLKAADDAFKNAYEVQKQETLQKWLSYQAQSRLGADKRASTVSGVQGEDVQATNMEKFVTEHYYSGDFPGVLFVDAALEYVQRPVEGIPVPVLGPPAWRIYPLRGSFHGLSRAMLSMLGNVSLRDLHLPIVFRVASYGYRSSIREPHVFDMAFSENQFSLAVNESGTPWLSKTTSYHKEQLKGIGGESEVLRKLGGNTMIGLGVKADKQ